MSGRIGVERIEIVRAEGPVDLVGKFEIADDFDDANAILYRWSVTVGQGHHEKCDFKVHFEDGHAYKGTIKISREGRLDLSAHIRSMLGILLEEDPEREGLRRWIDPTGSRKQAFLELVDNYDIPSPIPRRERAAPAPGM